MESKNAVSQSHAIISWYYLHKIATFMETINNVNQLVIWLNITISVPALFIHILAFLIKLKEICIGLDTTISFGEHVAENWDIFLQLK